MNRRLKAVYRDGAFVPSAPCELPEEAEVELLVQGPWLSHPRVTDPAERSQILAGLVDRMRENSLPAEAPRFTREELHERR